jgi:hypothetical protein
MRRKLIEQRLREAEEIDAEATEAPSATSSSI